jgi:hypothetical protein
MSHTRNPPPPEEQSQTPLWFAIGGLLVSLASFGLGVDPMVGDILFWTGGVIAVIALIYYFVRPTHGLPGLRK